MKTSTREARDVTVEEDALDWRCARDARAREDAQRCSALAARVEELGRRHTAAAKALAGTRARVEELVDDARRARERGEVAAKACDAMKRELTRAKTLNLDIERRATFELERGARARKALVEMVREAKSDLKDAREGMKEARTRAGLMEEWARRCDSAKRDIVVKLSHMQEECATLRRRMHTLAEENVRLRRRAMSDKREIEDVTDYGERLEREWTTTTRGERVVVRNPIFTEITDSSDDNDNESTEQTPYCYNQIS
jgi:chromosome segregation ATPase